MKRTEHKPLSFSTTMRNPERIAKFLVCIREFEGQILTETVIMQIVKKIIREKLYKPNFVSRVVNLSNIYEDETLNFTDNQIEEIISKSPQEHKEAGFSKGWASRFDTWYKLCKEFGFVYYEMNKKIELSTSGHMLSSAFIDNSENIGEKINKIFLNALSKYQTNNPFRRNLNENAPIPLLLNVINLLKKNDPKSAGVSRKELPFLMCWRNNDYEELYDFIIKFRKEYGSLVSDELVYEECLKLLDSENRKRFKISQIIVEGVDDLIRKLRITGIFSIRGMGRYVDINKLELDTVNYIINNYTKYETFEDEYSFYSYMGNVDSNILNFSSNASDDTNVEKIRIEALRGFARQYSNEQIYEELRLLQNKKASRDSYLKLIEAPTRLEFLTSIAILKKYPNYHISAHYSIDDEGNPISTARGGIADIEVYDENMNALIEVTLLRNKQQAVAEIPAITRHLLDKKNVCNLDVFSIFIAPQIHDDTIYMCQFTMYRDKLGIYPYTIVKFVETLQKVSTILEMKYDVNIQKSRVEG